LPIAEDLIPLTCPWNVEEMLTMNWFPELAQ
jgi:hypothetical protein